MQKRVYDVFLSHHSKDKLAVEILATRLEDKAGLNPFLDKWHLVPGEPWQEELEKALDESATCAVFLGPDGLGAWENEEMRSALDDRVRNKGFRVIPVLLPQSNPKDKEALPRFLRRLTWVDFRQGLEDEEAFNRLISGIRGERPGRGAALGLEKKKVQWTLVLSGTIEDVNKVHAEAIVNHLRKLSGDMELSLQRIEVGSVKLFIESSQEGYSEIEALYEQGYFQWVFGKEVLEVRIANEPRAPEAQLLSVMVSNRLRAIFVSIDSMVMKMRSSPSSLVSVVLFVVLLPIIVPYWIIKSIVMLWIDDD